MIVLFSFSLLFPSFSRAYQLESFQFVIEKTKETVKRNSMLESSISFIKTQQEKEFLSNEFTMEQRTKDYLLQQWMIPSSEKNGEDISFFSDISSYLEMDIWGVLEKSSDRMKTTDEYIAKGEILHSSLLKQHETFSAQVKGLNISISALKKEVSAHRKEYKNYLQGWNAEKINESKALILEKSNLLLDNQLEVERLNAYLKRLKNSDTLLQQKLQGAQENRDALIKNVRVQSESGKFIEAIE